MCVLSNMLCRLQVYFGSSFQVMLLRQSFINVNFQWYDCFENWAQGWRSGQNACRRRKVRPPFHHPQTRRPPIFNGEPRKQKKNYWAIGDESVPPKVSTKIVVEILWEHSRREILNSNIAEGLIIGWLNIPLTLFLPQVHSLLKIPFKYTTTTTCAMVLNSSWHLYAALVSFDLVLVEHPAFQTLHTGNIYKVLNLTSSKHY